MLNFHQQGKKSSLPPLLILHGLFASQRNWRAIATKLAQQHHVISVDLRNHGNSFHSPSMSYSEMAEDIFTLLDQLAIESATLLGHSMGGKVAMACALEQPHYVAGLCIADIAPIKYSHSHLPLITAMKTLPLANIHSRTDADRALVTQIPMKMLRQFLLQNLVIQTHDKTTDTRWRLNLAAIEDAHAGILSFPSYDTHFDSPCLFLRGQDSDYVKAEHESLIQNYFPAAQHVTIERAGHWLHAEQPVLFLQKITEFLDENTL